MKIITFFLSVFLIISCQDVVNLDLENKESKLVIQANITFQKQTSGASQVIRLTKSADFYNNVVPAANGAIVSVTNNNTQQIFNFIEDNNSGLYKCNNFIPIFLNTYTLKINYQNNNYLATEKLMPVAAISELVQDASGGINGKEIVVKAFYIDTPTEENFYLFNYFYTDKEDDFVKPVFYVSKDIFYNGNLFFSTTFKNGLKTGDEIKITHFGISQNYYNYLVVLLRLANQNAGPFTAPPVAVRGNIINQNNQNDFPFGYFSLSESDEKLYIVK